MVTALLEDESAIDDIDAILAVEGLDVSLIGHYDLSQSMGEPGDYNHPKVKEGVLDILKVCNKYKVPFGTTTTDSKAAGELVRRGCRFFEVIDEVSLIRQGAVQIVDGSAQEGTEPDEQQHESEKPAAQQDLGDDIEPFGDLCGHRGCSLKAGHDFQTSGTAAVLTFSVRLPPAISTSWSTMTLRRSGNIVSRRSAAVSMI